MEETSNDAGWERWLKIQLQATKLLVAGKASDAAEIVSGYGLDEHWPAETRSEAFAFRASIYEEQQELDKARDDLALACELSGKASYRRFTIEVYAGRVAEKLGDHRAAAGLYCAALSTAASCEEVTEIHSEILRLSRLNEAGYLDQSLREDVGRNIRLIWASLKIPGLPEGKSLVEIARLVEEAQKRVAAG